MTRRRLIIPQRVPIFLGAEGESEQAYGQLLNSLLWDAGYPVHFEVVDLGRGAGDPLARLRRAVQEIKRREERRTPFRLRATLLDLDQVHHAPDRRSQAETFAHQHHIRIIWQDPCHEAFLLRHFQGTRDDRPMTASDAIDRLNRVWPEYHKAMTRQELSRRIDSNAVARAEAAHDPLRHFLHLVRGLARRRPG